jgi:hypothetical protein
MNEAGTVAAGITLRPAVPGGLHGWGSGEALAEPGRLPYL